MRSVVLAVGLAALLCAVNADARGHRDSHRHHHQPRHHPVAECVPADGGDTGGGGDVDTGGGEEIQAIVTWYGYPDNSCPGGGGDCVAYPGPGRTGAGGTGTYDDPVTFAAQEGGMYAVGEIIYVEPFQLYARLEDICASCSNTWIDVWIGADHADEDELLACQEALTYWDTPANIILNPPDDLPVYPGPKYTDAGGCDLFGAP